VVLAAAWGSPPAHADRIAAIAVRRAPDGVVGFGLSGDERRGTTADYVPAFRRVRDAGLAAVPHAGFYHGAWHVREVVELLGATRVGHGLTALEDPAVVDLLAERGVTLEVCPTSYPPFGGPAPGELPLRALADAGVPVALATDDPLLFRTGLVGQYALVREHLDLSDAELARLATGSIRASCAPPALRERALAGVRDWLDSTSR
jgi:adenosine deaminase